MLNVFRAAGKYPAMIHGNQPLWRRAIDAGGRALGVGARRQQDAMFEIERATEEMRDHLERLRRESTPRLHTNRSRRSHP
jgi:hypothetical protein